MINRAIELTYDSSTKYEYGFEDVESDFWAYGDIIAATNTDVSVLVK